MAAEACQTLLAPSTSSWRHSRPRITVNILVSGSDQLLLQTVSASFYENEIHLQNVFLYSPIASISHSFIQIILTISMRLVTLARVYLIIFE